MTRGLELEATAFWRVTIPTILKTLGLWYVGKRWRLRKKPQQQTEFQLRPFVILEVTNEEGGWGLELRNVGNGSALDISVREVAVRLSASRTGVIRFPAPLPLLRAGEATRMKYTTEPNEVIQLLLLAGDESVYGPQSSPEAAPEITILFRNLEGAPYFVIERLFRGHLEIVDSGRL